MKRLSPQQWRTMQRVRAAGCPMDFRNLIRPCYPIQVSQVNDPDSRADNLLFSQRGLTLWVKLKITALVPVTLRAFRIEADWLEEELSWIPRCGQHPGDHCVHEWGLTISRYHVLTNLVLDAAGTLTTGESFSGVLVGQNFQDTAPLGFSYVTLFVQVQTGEDLPFRLRVRNTGSYQRVAKDSSDG